MHQSHLLNLNELGMTSPPLQQEDSKTLSTKIMTLITNFRIFIKLIKISSHKNTIGIFLKNCKILNIVITRTSDQLALQWLKNQCCLKRISLWKFFKAKINQKDYLTVKIADNILTNSVEKLTSIHCESHDYCPNIKSTLSFLKISI